MKTIAYNKVTGSKLILENYDKRIVDMFIETCGGIENVEIDQEALNEFKLKEMETHIYSMYPQKKQSQDQVWVTDFKTKLVAMGITDVEAKVINGVNAFYNGTPIAEYLKDESTETKPLFEKLIKIGIRSEWVYRCVQEGKKAIAENREPNYPDFPRF